MSSFYFEIFHFIKIRIVWNLVKGMTCKIVLIPFKRLLKSYTLSLEERHCRHTYLTTYYTVFGIFDAGSDDGISVYLFTNS